MILEKHLRELAQIRAHFINAILEKCNEPTVQLEPETSDPTIFDGPIKVGTVRLEVTNSDSGIKFEYVLDGPEPEPKDISSRITKFETKP